MHTARTWLTLAVVGLVTAAGAQDLRDRSDRPRRPRPGQDYPPAGFWPTERMMDLFFDRISENLAKHYSFDDSQMLATRNVLKERFPAWLEQNRAEIQALTNQYFEALMDKEPPTPEEVAIWAQRVQPLVGEFTALLDDTTQQMRSYMTDDQQVLLSGELAAAQVGLNNLNQRLTVWSEGGYDWETEWPGSEGFRQTRAQREEQLRVEAEAAKAAAMGQTVNPAGGVPTAGTESGGGTAPDNGAPGASTANPKPPNAPRIATAKAKDDWAAYVEDFIRRYKLDDAQQNQAHKILAQLQEARDKYLRRKASEIANLEILSASAKTDEERDKVRKRYEEVNGPVERLFKQLKDRLDTVPTRRQRAQAELAELESRNAGGADAKKADAKAP